MTATNEKANATTMEEHASPINPEWLGSLFSMSVGDVVLAKGGKENATLLDDDTMDRQQQFVSSSDMPMDNNQFCKPMMMMGGHGPMLGGGTSKGMVMYMDGFHFATSGNQSCLNLFFPGWTLDTPGKFFGGVLLVFLLAFGTEGVSKLRHNVSISRNMASRQARRRRAAANTTDTSASATSASSSSSMDYPVPDRLGQILISSLHGVQALLGYVVMLATMTFSVEILLSVVLGLSSGYYYFFAGEVGLEGHVTTNPCCSYMQDESDEHEQHELLLQQQHAARQSQQQSTPTRVSQQDETLTTSLLSSEVGCCGNPIENDTNA